MIKGLALILLCSLVVPSLSHAQLAVADAPVLATVASSLTVLKGIYDETVRQMAAIANLGTIMAQMRNFAVLISEVEGLMNDIAVLTNGWDQLSASGSVICDLADAVAWKSQASQWAYKAQRLAMTAQRLMGRSINILRALEGIISGISGTVSGAQGTTAILSAMAAQLQELSAITAAAHTATMGPGLIENIVGLQVLCIHQGHFAGWGSYSR